MADAERDDLDRFDAYLDARAEAERTHARAELPTGDLDPVLTETVRRLRALDAADAPDPALANQIWEELMNHLGLAGAVPLTTTGAKPALNGRAVPRPWRAYLPALPVSKARRRWAMAQLATGLLLLVTLFAMYVAFRPTNDNAVAPVAGTPTTIPAPTKRCGSTGGGASAPTGSPVAVNLVVASPAAGTNPAVSFVWAADDPGTGFTSLSYMAIDPQCRLWVTDITANRFLIFDLDGHLLETWGTAGSSEGQFNFYGNEYFGGIAFAADGGFYVCDFGNQRIQQFDADRRFVRAWGMNDGETGEVVWPTDVAVGPDGNVYVAGYTGILQVFTPDGELVREFANVGSGPGDVDSAGSMAFDPAGNVWTFSSGPSLAQFTPTGERLARIDLTGKVGEFIFGLAIDAAGRFFVVDGSYGKVSVFDPRGILLFSWGEPGTDDGQFQGPLSIVLDGAGGVYVAQNGNSRIQKFQVQP